MGKQRLPKDLTAAQLQAVMDAFKEYRRLFIVNGIKVSDEEMERVKREVLEDVGIRFCKMRIGQTISSDLLEALLTDMPEEDEDDSA